MPKIFSKELFWRELIYYTEIKKENEVLKLEYDGN